MLYRVTETTSTGELRTVGKFHDKSKAEYYIKHTLRCGTQQTDLSWSYKEYITINGRTGDKQGVKTNQEERSRELIRHQYTESDKSTEWYFPNLKEGSLWYPEI